MNNSNDKALTINNILKVYSKLNLYIRNKKELVLLDKFELKPDNILNSFGLFIKTTSFLKSKNEVLALPIRSFLYLLRLFFQLYKIQNRKLVTQTDLNDYQIFIESINVKSIKNVNICFTSNENIKLILVTNSRSNNSCLLPIITTNNNMEITYDNLILIPLYYKMNYKFTSNIYSCIYRLNLNLYEESINKYMIYKINPYSILNLIIEINEKSLTDITNLSDSELFEIINIFNKEYITHNWKVDKLIIRNIKDMKEIKANRRFKKEICLEEGNVLEYLDMIYNLKEMKIKKMIFSNCSFNLNDLILYMKSNKYMNLYQMVNCNIVLSEESENLKILNYKIFIKYDKIIIKHKGISKLINIFSIFRSLFNIEVDYLNISIQYSLYDKIVSIKQLTEMIKLTFLIKHKLKLTVEGEVNFDFTGEDIVLNSLFEFSIRVKFYNECQFVLLYNTLNNMEKDENKGNLNLIMKEFNLIMMFFYYQKEILIKSISSYDNDLIHENTNSIYYPKDSYLNKLTNNTLIYLKDSVLPSIYFKDLQLSNKHLTIYIDIKNSVQTLFLIKKIFLNSIIKISSLTIIFIKSPISTKNKESFLIEEIFLFLKSNQILINQITIKNTLLEIIGFSSIVEYIDFIDKDCLFHKEEFSFIILLEDVQADFLFEKDFLSLLIQVKELKHIKAFISFKYLNTPTNYSVRLNSFINTLDKQRKSICFSAQNNSIRKESTAIEHIQIKYVDLNIVSLILKILSLLENTVKSIFINECQIKIKNFEEFLFKNSFSIENILIDNSIFDIKYKDVLFSLIDIKKQSFLMNLKRLDIKNWEKNENFDFLKGEYIKYFGNQIAIELFGNE